MAMRRLVLLVLLLVPDCFSQSRPIGRAREYPTPMVREEQKVVVGGVTETWRLEWAAAPTPHCEGPITCPCSGFAYGESGDLYLTRLHEGVQIERLHLSPLFDAGVAIVQRWPWREKDEEREVSEEIIRRRKTVQVMRFRDYDHDGNRTEFYLQASGESCKSWGFVIGVSKRNKRLHVFGTISNPNVPLPLQEREWQALRNAKSGSVKVIDWACGDHAAETQTELLLRWSIEGIDGVRREYTCPGKNRRRRLIKEELLSE